MSIKNTVIVDRLDLKAWADGELLNYREGLGFAVNELACTEAIAALDRGEVVLLTEAGKLTGTQVRKDGNEYVEEWMETDD